MGFSDGTRTAVVFFLPDISVDISIDSVGIET